MKRKIAKAAWDALEPALQALYKLVGKDYVLDLEDEEEEGVEPGDSTAAKTALERKHRKAAEKARDEAVAALEALQAEKETVTNGTAQVKASYDKKVAKLEKERDEALLTHKNYLGNDAKSKAADKIANALTKTPKLLMPHLMSRLDVDYDGDTPAVVVLDGNGKRSATTLDELTKEFRDNKDFASIVTASQASGGGAARPGVTPNGGRAPNVGNPDHQQQPVSLGKLSPADLKVQIQARREARGQTQAQQP